MDRRNNGLPVDCLANAEYASGGPDTPCRAPQAPQFVYRTELTLPDIGPRAKGTSRPRDDEDMQVVVLVKSAMRLQQFIAHGIAVGVEHTWPVERNVRNPPLGLVQDGFISHAVSPFGLRQDRKS